ncbi:MAG TPA: hypothetical protein PKY77_25875, partial [Phycisphaerae bacterium]|nr:hypothetical protein [Phycisphaerae bacterium]
LLGRVEKILNSGTGHGKTGANTVSKAACHSPPQPLQQQQLTAAPDLSLPSLPFSLPRPAPEQRVIDDTGLLAVVKAWSGLTPETRATILGLIDTQQERTYE